MSEVQNESAASESILISVRPMCNVDKDDDGFDEKLIPLINSQMMIAHHEIGIGINGFNITGEPTAPAHRPHCCPRGKHDCGCTPVAGGSRDRTSNSHLPTRDLSPRRVRADGRQ